MTPLPMLLRTHCPVCTLQLARTSITDPTEPCILHQSQAVGGRHAVCLDAETLTGSLILQAQVVKSRCGISGMRGSGACSSLDPKGTCMTFIAINCSSRSSKNYLLGVLFIQGNFCN